MWNETVTLSRDIGNRYYEATTLTNLGDTHHTTGNHHAARAAWQHALTILTDIDHPDAETIRIKLRQTDSCCGRATGHIDPRHHSMDNLRTGGS